MKDKLTSHTFFYLHARWTTDFGRNKVRYVRWLVGEGYGQEQIKRIGELIRLADSGQPVNYSQIFNPVSVTDGDREDHCKGDNDG